MIYVDGDATTFTAYADLETGGLSGTAGWRIVSGTTTVVARTTAGVVANPAGTGIYVITGTPPAADGTYLLIVDTGGTLPQFASEEMQIGGTIPELVTFTPVAQAADVIVIRGDDYNDSDGRALEWAGILQDLTGSTVKFRTKDAAGTVLDVTASQVTADGVKVELTTTHTSALSPSRPTFYDLQATLPGGRTVTVAQGRVVVAADQR